MYSPAESRHERLLNGDEPVIEPDAPIGRLAFDPMDPAIPLTLAPSDDDFSEDEFWGKYGHANETIWD